MENIISSNIKMYTILVLCVCVFAAVYWSRCE